MCDFTSDFYAINIWAHENHLAGYIGSSILYKNMFFFQRSRDPFFYLVVLFKKKGKALSEEQADYLLDLSVGHGAFCLCEDWKDATGKIAYYLSGKWKQGEWQNYEALYE